MVLVVALAVAGLGAVWFVQQPEDLPEDSVLRYEGTTVSEDDLRARVQVLTALYGVVRPEDPEDAEEFDRLAAQSYAVSLIIDHEAGQRDLEVGGKETRDQLDALIEDQLPGGRASFVDFLEETRISENDVLDEIQRQLKTSRLAGEVTEGAEEVTDEDVVAAFEKARDKLVRPASRNLANIVVIDRATAERVSKLARRGANFAQLAATYSRDEETSHSGGELGWLTSGELEAGYAAAAFAAAPRSVFGPVRTRYGWNVGMVHAGRPPRPLSFAQVEAELRTQLENAARLEVWREFLGELLADADVEYAPDYEPDDPEALPTELPDPESESP